MAVSISSSAARSRPWPPPVAEVLAATDFPVTWEDPADADIYWTRDVMHYPHQVTPLDFDIGKVANTPGRAEALHRYWGLPQWPLGRLVNTFQYGGTVLAVPPAEAAERSELADRRCLSMCHRAGLIWEEWQPEIEFHIARWRAFDLPGANTDELLRHFDDSLVRLRRAWYIHFLVTRPSLMAMDQFNCLYAELFPEASSLEPLRLLRGGDNKTVETGRELWKLSRILGTAEFPAELDAFLQAYGHRADSLAITDLSWIEDPSSVLAQVRAFAANPDRDPSLEQQRQIYERETATAQARARLAGYPARVRELFETWLPLARTATTVWEDHNFYIDACCDDEMRQVVREVARRAVRAGGIEEVADAPMLSIDELRKAVQGVDQRTQVAAQRALQERFSGVAAPLALGPPPPASPAGAGARASIAFFGGPPPPSEPGLIRGTPASAGVVRGIARVRHHLEAVHGLQPGEVLVVPSTTQAWTPLFAFAGAVVSDSGGVLCHCALVAREYGIAAVVGTAHGTELIPDGSLVEVDGEAGTVRVLEG